MKVFIYIHFVIKKIMIHIMKTPFLFILLFLVQFTYGQQSIRNVSSIEILKYDHFLLQDDPEAGFIADSTEGVFPLEVIFTNTSVNASQYNWIFGDGATSTEVSPTHIYTQPGEYTVSLIASNGSIPDTLTKTNYIVVEWPTPKADFIGTPLAGVDPLTVVFTDKSENAQTWLWNFGDGTSSIEQHPTHIYKRGSFSVSLLITNPSNNDFIVKQNFISVDPNGLAEKLNGILKVYPIPTNEKLTIELPNENYKKVVFELYDIHGKLLKRGVPGLNTLIKYDFNLNDIESGNYLLHIIINNESLVETINKR
jgi:PKD repeat protein